MLFFNIKLTTTYTHENTSFKRSVPTHCTLSIHYTLIDTLILTSYYIMDVRRTLLLYWPLSMDDCEYLIEPFSPPRVLYHYTAAILMLYSLAPRDVVVILKCFLRAQLRFMFTSIVKLLSRECHRTHSMISLWSWIGNTPPSVKWRPNSSKHVYIARLNVKY